MPVGPLIISFAPMHENFTTGLFKAMMTRERNRAIIGFSPLFEIFSREYNYLKDANPSGMSNVENYINLNISVREMNGTIKLSHSHNTDPISIAWYLASFAALMMFFLMISFSEVYCKKPTAEPPELKPDLPPPPYENFAPPTYNSIFGKKENLLSKGKKRIIEVFIVPMFGTKTTAPN